MSVINAVATLWFAMTQGRQAMHLGRNIDHTYATKISSQ